jgi:hypothetical protein
MYGQTANTGAIAGSVSDPSGAPVAGAAVVINSEATGEENLCQRFRKRFYKFFVFNVEGIEEILNGGVNNFAWGPHEHVRQRRQRTLRERVRISMPSISKRPRAGCAPTWCPWSELEASYEGLPSHGQPSNLARQ